MADLPLVTPSEPALGWCQPLALELLESPLSRSWPAPWWKPRYYAAWGAEQRQEQVNFARGYSVGLTLEHMCGLKSGKLYMPSHPVISRTPGAQRQAFGGCFSSPWAQGGQTACSNKLSAKQT